MPAPRDDLDVFAPRDPDADDDFLDLEEGDFDAPLDMTLSDSAAATLGAAQIEDRLRRLGAESDGRRRLNALLPWIASIVAHLAALSIAIAVTWAVVRTRAPEEAVLVVADFDRPTYRPVDAGTLAPAELGAASLAPPTLPMPRVLDASAMAGPAIGAPGAAPVDWSPPAERSASFAGVRASNSRRVVYVVDASGSMVGTLPIIVDELSRSLRALGPDQQFAIVFFQRNEALGVAPGDRTIPATTENVERALRWIRQRVVPAGRSNPLKALEAALRMRPDAIFLLSMNITGAGQFEIDQRELLQRLDRLNPADSSGRRRALIQCIQFLEVDPLDTLRRIAEAHGGAGGYRFLGRAELGVK